MPVCPSCFAYYVRAPCPYCADAGNVNPITRSVIRKPATATRGPHITKEKPLKTKVENLQSKTDSLQEEMQQLKSELTEKNRIVTQLEADLRSCNDDKNFLLNKISETEGDE